MYPPGTLFFISLIWEKRFNGEVISGPRRTLGVITSVLIHHNDRVVVRWEVPGQEKEPPPLAFSLGMVKKVREDGDEMEETFHVCLNPKMPERTLWVLCFGPDNSVSPTVEDPGPDSPEWDE
jgi:hypothetical protein